MLKKKLSKKITDKPYSMRTNGITQSLLSTWCQCPRKALFKVNRWEGFKRDTTNFGTLVHNVLEKLYLNKSVINNNNTTTTKVLGKWIDETESDAISALKAMVIMVNYVKLYKSDFTTKKFEQVEQKFDIPFFGFRLLGKIDGVYRDKSGKLWIIEHKTKSQINEDDLMLKLSFDFQNLFYIICTELIYDEPVQGVLYNVIRNPAHRQGKGQSIMDFQKKLQVEIDKDHSHFFMRYEIPYTQKQKDYFQMELNEKLNAMNNQIEGGKLAYKVQGACSSPFKCEFLNACSSDTMTGYSQKKELFSELK